MAAPTPPPADIAQVRGDRISLRRALTLLGMTLLVPGSAQVAAGNSGLGRFAMRVWLGVIALVLVVAAVFLINRNWAIGLYANAVTPWIVALAFLMLGIGWIALLVDAWRLGQPRALATGHRVFVSGLALLLAVVMGFTSWQAFGIFRSQADLFGHVFAGGGNTTVTGGRINILLLGGDAGAGRDGLRPDSMTVASVDATTGRTVLISLERNLQGAPIPEGNPLRAKYPNGFRCAEQACMLNGLYTEANDNKKLFPGDPNPGLTTTRAVIQNITGLQINYYALVDMEGFRELIDALGGIYLDIPYNVPLGDENTPLSKMPYLDAGQHVHLDGDLTLRFVRTRVQSTDYSRMIRQKCVMSAMLKQLSPTNVLSKFQEIVQAGKDIVETDVPSSQIGTLIDLASKAKNLPIASTAISPPLVPDTVNPDWAKIKVIVADSITASQKLDQADAGSAAATPTTSATPSKASTAKPSTAKASASASTKTTKATATATSSAYQAGQTDNLDQVCGVS